MKGLLKKARAAAKECGLQESDIARTVKSVRKAKKKTKNKNKS